jgi:CDP-diglyceride synthetase
MNPNHVLIALLVFGAVLSGYLEFLQMRRLPEPEIVQVGSMIAFSVLTFAWYKFDSDIRGYKRSPLLNVSVVALGLLVVPYYLIRSRERGHRLKAVISFIGYVLAFVVALVLGALPVRLIS